jgi:hypothetical protein
VGDDPRWHRDGGIEVRRTMPSDGAVLAARLENKERDRDDNDDDDVNENGTRGRPPPSPPDRIRRP